MLASVEALLSLIVDYAGLFPPANLSLREAMTNYVQSSASTWMLGRFVIPASLLNEFEELLPMFPLKRWLLSVVLSKDLESDIERVLSFNGGDKISITAWEFPPLPPAEIERVSGLPAGVDVFFEIPFREDLEPYLAILRHTGASAKIRTGGTTIDAFPSMTQLCRCIFSFATQVPFKATAGLHHALLAKHRLTSEPDSPSILMHGFLNVAIVAAFVHWQKVTPEEALEILKQTSVHGFQFKADSIFWSDRRLDISEIEAARQHFFRSFGSCSFQEPRDDLKHLKLLS